MPDAIHVWAMIIRWENRAFPGLTVADDVLILRCLGKDCPWPESLIGLPCWVRHHCSLLCAREGSDSATHQVSLGLATLRCLFGPTQQYCETGSTLCSSGDHVLTLKDTGRLRWCLRTTWTCLAGKTTSLEEKMMDRIHSHHKDR